LKNFTRLRQLNKNILIVSAFMPAVMIFYSAIYGFPLSCLQQAGTGMTRE
jgi:hypothetical protein